jgi:hypothetical protein
MGGEEPVRVLGGGARMGLAWGAQGARRRRCGAIVDGEQPSDCRATPMRPSGSGFARASAALPLLDDGTASPASRRLASACAKPGTRPLLILGQVPRFCAGKSIKRRQYRVERFDRVCLRSPSQADYRDSALGGDRCVRHRATLLGHGSLISSPHNLLT